MPNARVDPFPRYNFLVEIEGIARAGFMTVSGLEEESEVREYREERHVHGFRYYDPEVGRYITRDQTGYDAGMNLYIHVGCNPINHTDPLGLFMVGYHVVRTSKGNSSCRRGQRLSSRQRNAAAMAFHVRLWYPKSLVQHTAE